MIIKESTYQEAFISRLKIKLPKQEQQQQQRINLNDEKEFWKFRIHVPFKRTKAHRNTFHMLIHRLNLNTFITETFKKSVTTKE